jgi:hypothetical protein
MGTLGAWSQTTSPSWISSARFRIPGRGCSSKRCEGVAGELVSVLSDWTTDDEIKFGRSVTPEVAETAIVELAALVRPLFPQTAAGPPLGSAGGP